MTKPGDDDPLDPEEAARRCDEIALRMLKTPPKKHKDEPRRRPPAKRQPAKKG